MPIVWLLGTIIGPSVSSFTVGRGFSNYPYLLPNLICAALLLVSIIVGWFYLEETHPDFIHTDDGDIASVIAPAELHIDCYGTFNRLDSEENLSHLAEETTPLISITHAPTSAEPKAFTRRVIALIVAIGFFAYHSMCWDHLLPIFLQDQPSGVATDALPTGGLGWSIQEVGMLLSANGVIALVVQIVLFPMAASYVGVFRLFQIVVTGHPIVYICIPFISALPEAWQGFGLYGELVLRNVFTIMLYPVLLILLKDAAPKPSVLGKVNGMAAAVGALTRAIAPPAAGILYGMGETRGIAGLAWFGAALVAGMGAMQAMWIKRQKTVTMDAVEEGCYDGKKHAVHIQVTEVDSD